MHIELKKIQVQNFLSYGQNLEKNLFVFQNGLDIVTATNGSGKSAIFLDALNYGLFGKPFRKIKLQSLQNNINTKELLVSIDLETNSREYTIIRGMNPNRLEIYENGYLLPEESSIKSYQNMLEENILGMTEDVFKSLIAISSGMNSSRCFLDLSNKEKEELFNCLIDTKIFQDMSDITRKHINEHKTFNTEYEYKMKVLSEFLETEKLRIKDLQDYNRKITEEKEIDIQNTENRLNELEEKNIKIENALKKEDSIKEKKDLLEKDISDFDNNIDSDEKHLKEIKEKLLLIKSAKKSAIECKECGTINYTIEIDPNLIASEGSLEADKSRIELGITDMKNKLQEARESLEETKNKLNKISFIKKELLKNKEEIEELKNKIETLKNSNVLKIDTSIYKTKKEEYLEVKKDFLLNKEKLEQYQYIYEVVYKSSLRGEVISSQIPLLNKYINDFLEKFSMNNYNIVISKDFKEKIISRNVSTEFSQLSNGQKSRISFAIMFGFLKLMEQRNAITMNLLVLDEVLDSSLDLNGKNEIIEILRQEFTEKKDVILITHNSDIKERMELFDREVNITRDRFSKLEVID